MQKDTRPEIPTGQVQITPHGAGWFLVEIGRGRYTKRFNLSDAELRLIRRWANERIEPD